jgi:hypothetical protein
MLRLTQPTLRRHSAAEIRPEDFDESGEGLSELNLGKDEKGKKKKGKRGSLSPGSAKGKKGKSRTGSAGSSDGDYNADEGEYPGAHETSWSTSHRSKSSKVPLDRPFVGFKFADSPYKAAPQVPGAKGLGPKGPAFHAAGGRNRRSVPCLRDADAITRSYQNVHKMLKDPRVQAKGKKNKISVDVRLPAALPGLGDDGDGLLDEDDEGSADGLGPLGSGGKLGGKGKKNWLSKSKTCPDLSLDNTKSTAATTMGSHFRTSSEFSAQSDGFGTEATRGSSPSQGVTLPEIKPSSRSRQSGDMRALAQVTAAMDARFRKS